MTAKYLKVEVMGQPVFILFNQYALKHSDVANDLRLTACVQSAGLLKIEEIERIKTGLGSPSMGLSERIEDAAEFKGILSC